MARAANVCIGDVQVALVEALRKCDELVAMAALKRSSARSVCPIAYRVCPWPAMAEALVELTASAAIKTPSDSANRFF